jgi:O-antigen/teichoic acid export membrane protein
VTARRSGWLGLWARDSSIVLVSQVTALVATTALAVVVARDLGPADFGVLAALQGVALILTVFVDAGIATYVLRELTTARHAGPQGEPVHAASLVSAGLSAAASAATILLVASVSIGAVLLQNAELALALGGLVGYTSLLACADSLEVVYRAGRRLGLLAAAILLEKGVLVTVVSVALLAHGGILAIAAGYLAAGAVRLAFDLIAVRGLGMVAWHRPSRAAIAGVLRGALPFGLGSTIPTAVVRLDATLISFVSTTAAGLYAVGDRILTVLLIVPSTSAATLFPLLGREHSIRETAHRAASVMFLAGGVIAVTGIELAPFVVPRLFGTAYQEAVVPVQLMLLATPFAYASSMLMTGLYSRGREHLVLMVMLGCTVAGTAFVVGGQLAFGVDGAAAGYALRFLGFFAALGVTSRRARGHAHAEAAKAFP